MTEFEFGEPAQALGFVTPFGEAPPDFAGQTLVDFDNIRALLGIGWTVEGTDSPFLSMDASGIVLDVDNPDVGLRHFIKVGPRVTDITTFDSPMTIEPDTNVRRVFAVSVARRLEMYVDFGVFVDRVNALLNTTSTHDHTHGARIVRRGFDDADGELRGDHVHGAVKGTHPFKGDGHF